MQKILQFIFYYRSARLTLAFVKNLCFSNSAAVGLKRKEDRFLHYIHNTTGESYGKKNKLTWRQEKTGLGIN